MTPVVTLYPFDPAAYTEFAALLQPDGGLNITEIVSASKKHKSVDDDAWKSNKAKFTRAFEVLWAKGIVPMQMKIKEAASLSGHGGPKKNKKWGTLVEAEPQKGTVADVLYQLLSLLEDAWVMRIEAADVVQAQAVGSDSEISI